MSLQGRRHLQTVAGRGRVYRGQERIADVLYTLDVFQDYIVSGASRGSDELPPSVKDILGSLTVVSGQQALRFHEPTLTLELEDGRLLNFIVTRRQLPGGACRVVGSSGFFTREEPKNS